MPVVGKTTFVVESVPPDAENAEIELETNVCAAASVLSPAIARGCTVYEGVPAEMSFRVVVVL
jgi:hypothetical protein